MRVWVDKILRIIQPYFPYIAVILLICLPWFIKPGYLFLSDTVWGPVIKLDWTSYDFLFNLIVKALSIILPVSFIEKIFISGVLLLIILGGRKLVTSILALTIENNEEQINSGSYVKSITFVLSLFVLFNPFVYDRALYGQFTTLAAYGCLLFVLAYLLDCFQTLNFTLLKRAGVFTGLALMFSLHSIFFLLPFYLLFFVALFLKRNQIKEKKILSKFFISFALLVVIVLAINLNQIIAIISNNSSVSGFVEKGITEKDLLAFETSGKNAIETFTNVLFMSGFWGKDQSRYFDITSVDGWDRSIILLLPIVFFGIWRSFYHRSRNEKILSISLLMVFIMAVILAVGIKAPVAKEISLFLYNHLPLYKGMREPQKWVSVIIPIYLFYLTIGVYRFKNFKIIEHNKFVSGVLLSAIIIMQTPSMIWGFNNQIRATRYPDDWIEINNFFVNNSQDQICNDSVLFLPWHLYMSFAWIGKIVANPAPHFFACPVVSGTNMEWKNIYDNSQNLVSSAVDEWLRRKGENGPPKVTGPALKYIVVAKEIDWRNYRWIEKLDYLKLIKDTRTLLLYEIQR